MASGPPLDRAVAVELDGLLDGVAAGGGGDVDELLDVPPGRLGPVGVDVEAAVHPRARHRRRPSEDAHRYGYQSVRAGSQRCTCASTTRVGRAVIGPPCGGWPRGADDLAERGVEPIGDGGTAVGDAADRSGMAAQAEPARRPRPAPHRPGRPPRGGRAGARPARPTGRRRLAPDASMPTAKAVTRPSVAPAADPGQLGRGLRPAAARRRWWRRSGSPAAPAGRRRRRSRRPPGPMPASAWMSLDDPAVVGRARRSQPSVGGRRSGGRPAGATTTASIGPARLDDGAQRLGGAAEAVRHARRGGR